MQQKQKGFTLIELLVVIAIIGILATIVLTSLGSARSKANDAKVQAQLSSMRAQAELYYSSHGDNYGPSSGGDCDTASTMYTATGADNGLAGLLGNIGGDYTVTCYTDPATGGAEATAWAVFAANSDATGQWCVDSTGQSNSYGNDTVDMTSLTTDAVCPVPA